jgi:hypothetical protein
LARRDQAADARALQDFLGRRDAVGVAEQPDVHEDEVGSVGDRHGDRFFSASGRPHHRVTLIRQGVFHHRAQEDVVFHDQNAPFRL